ncbi:MAG: sigma 54-interacting transcriptional regulator [Bacteroidales bacterium]|jgi:transcriptional regulator with PAS, ATPase and Fis domain|nr:sigma 54-interacting transcriptional regulator [Bacteroidales bacterium]
MNYFITDKLGLPQLKEQVEYFLNLESDIRGSENSADKNCIFLSNEDDIPENLEGLALVIDDEENALIDIVNYLSNNQFVKNIICIKNRSTFNNIITRIKSKPIFISLDFDILSVPGEIYNDTSAVYLRIKELYPNVPLIGYTNFEESGNPERSPETKKLTKLLNKNNDSVFDKKNINSSSAYNNIVRDKIRMSKILEENRKLSQKNSILSKENKQLKTKSQLQDEEIKYITSEIENPLFEEIPLIGTSAPMKRIKFFVEKLANSYDPDDIEPIHLFGASGTGKENIAKAIHRLDKKRCHKELVEVDCTAIPETLFESEMFGYDKGGHSTATTNKIGRFEEANGSTLFLDEIGDLTPTNQTKLLKVLQDKKFRRVGGTKDIAVNFRLITATNHNLTEMVSEKKFNEALFNRISSLFPPIPSLKERKDDIPLLISHFAKKSKKSFSKDAIEYISTLPLQGNIRDLQKIVKQVSQMVSNSVIEVGDIEYVMNFQCQSTQHETTLVSTKKN